MNEYIAMFALFIGTGLAVWIAFGFVRKTIENLHLRAWDRQAGGLLGAIKGCLLCMLITLFAVTLLGEAKQRAIVNSHSGRLITQLINRVAVAVPTNMREDIDEYLQKYNEEVQQHHDPSVTTPPVDLGEWVSGPLHTEPPDETTDSEAGYEGQVTRGGESDPESRTGGFFFDPNTNRWLELDAYRERVSNWLSR